MHQQYGSIQAPRPNSASTHHMQQLGPQLIPVPSSSHHQSAGILMMPIECHQHHTTAFTTPHCSPTAPSTRTATAAATSVYTTELSARLQALLQPHAPTHPPFSTTQFHQPDVSATVDGPTSRKRRFGDATSDWKNGEDDDEEAISRLAPLHRHRLRKASTSSTTPHLKLPESPGCSFGSNGSDGAATENDADVDVDNSFIPMEDADDWNYDCPFVHEDYHQGPYDHEE